MKKIFGVLLTSTLILGAQKKSQKVILRFPPKLLCSY